MQTLQSKTIAFLLAFSMAFSSVFYAQRDARAFWPIVIPIMTGAIEINLSSGGVVALTTVATALGLTAWFLYFKKPDGSVGLTVKLNSKAVQPVPSGWSAAADPSNDPVPPSAPVPAIQNWGGGASTALEACATPATSGGYTLTSASGSPTANCYGTNAANPSPILIGQVFLTLSCPSGFAYPGAGTDCNLATPDAVKYPSDGKCQVKLTSGSFDAEGRDTDCDGGPSSGSVLSSDGKKITISDGAKKTVITSKPDNSISVENWTGNGDGTSTYTAATIGAPDSGSSTGGTALTGFSTGRVAGEGSLAGEGSTAETGGSGSGSCGAPSEPPCKIDESGTPSTGASAADEAKAALTAKTPGDFGVGPWSGSGVSIFSNLPSLSGSDSCVNPITWVWMGHTLMPDVCAIWGPLKSTLSWFLYAMTALYIWRRTIGALA